MNRNSIIRNLCTLVMLVFSMTLCAQQESGDSVTADRIAMTERVLDYTDELKQLYATIKGCAPTARANKLDYGTARSVAERLKVINRSMKSIEFRWNTYYQTIQGDMAEDEDLMNQASAFQLVQQNVRDSLNKETANAQLLIDFCQAEEMLLKQKPLYKKIFNKATSLSFVAKLAPQLEKLKVQEQLQFQEIQQQYDKAKAAADAMPLLRKRMQSVEQNYVMLKDASEKIQASAYKPLIQRVKDYLIGIAAVAILMMFFSMVHSKISSWMKMRENLKKAQQMMNNGNNGTYYPTI